MTQLEILNCQMGLLEMENVVVFFKMAVKFRRLNHSIDRVKTSITFHMDLTVTFFNFTKRTKRLNPTTICQNIGLKLQNR